MSSDPHQVGRATLVDIAMELRCYPYFSFDEILCCVTVSHAFTHVQPFHPDQ